MMRSTYFFLSNNITRVHYRVWKTMASALSTATTKEEIREKILRCAKSWNPVTRLSIPGLREEERHLVEMERERRAKESWNPITRFSIPGLREEERQLVEMERERREKEQERREMEVRVINVVDDYEIRRFGVSRKIFEGWTIACKQLIDDDGNHVVKYDEIKEDATYFFASLK